MKKIKKLELILLLLLVFPFQVFCYSEYIIPGGESVGIEIKTDGILVVGFYKINGKFNKGTPFMKVGDKILKVDGKDVTTVDELVGTLEEDVNSIHKVTVSRDGKIKEIALELVREDDTYKTGLYVKDEISGLGTLTYIDPESKIYGALGHNVVETNTNKAVEVKDGSIFKSSITSIDRSTSGTPGGKNAKFFSNNVFGSISKNDLTGIYGNYTKAVPEKDAMKVATIDEVEVGKASIYTVLDGEALGEYDIEITKVDTESDVKNIYFKVTDKTLLERTGGIVQGMSGSPIIQNGKIVGAVTHVVVSNPDLGYGISIVSMLEKGEE